MMDDIRDDIKTDSRKHFWNVIGIICFVGLADAFLKAQMFPSREEFKQVLKFLVFGRGDGPSISGMLLGARYLRFFVGLKHFARDAVFLIPAVLIRFLLWRRQIFDISGGVLTVLASIALGWAFISSRGIAAIGENMGRVLVVYGFCRIMTLKNPYDE